MIRIRGYSGTHSSTIGQDTTGGGGGGGVVVVCVCVCVWGGGGMDNAANPWYAYMLSHYSDVMMGAIASQITSLTIGLLNRIFRTSKLRVTGLCAGNSPGTGEFPTLMASNAENVSIWWRYHAHRRR